MLIVRDPANTTPAKTGNLCFVCNSRNPTDKTARHAFDLWRAAVALCWTGEASLRYLKNHYWTNASLHGTDVKRLPQACRHCQGVLEDQIELLQPRVVIASGKDASSSLFHLGLMSRPWDQFRKELADGPVGEIMADGTRVFCTYHTSIQPVNTHIARLYSQKTEEHIRKEMNKLPNTEAAENFFRYYPKEMANGRGMRVLLLHWLEIGKVIREPL